MKGIPSSAYDSSNFDPLVYLDMLTQYWGNVYKGGTSITADTVSIEKLGDKSFSWGIHNVDVYLDDNRNYVITDNLRNSLPSFASGQFKVNYISSEENLDDYLIGGFGKNNL